jgi:predicted RNase H-like HicB family nuclease
MSWRFLIVVERAGANFSAYSPDLPGCVATGATPDETKGRMQEAIDLHLRGLREDHLPIPEPSAVAEYVEVGP